MWMPDSKSDGMEETHVMTYHYQDKLGSLYIS